MGEFAPIFIVIFVIALALGPVMMMQPTKAQKALAELRAGAASRGLLLKSNQAGGMNYILPWGSTPDFDEQWCLKKLSYEHGAHFFKDWDFDGEAASLRSDPKSSLQQLIPSLHDVSELGLNRVGVYLCWNERLAGKTANESLSEIGTKLMQLRQIF